MTDPKEAEYVRQRAETLEDHVRVLIEAGLFVDSQEDIAPIAGAIKEARGKLGEGNLSEASTTLTSAEADLVTHTFARGRLWRAVNIHQVPLFLYFIAVLLAVTALSRCLDGDSALLGVPASIIVLGSLGAVLRGLWWLYRKVTRRQYRPHFLIANLSAPFFGALLAFFAYLLLAAGVLSLEGTTVESFESAALPHAIAFISGYSWEWLVERVDRIINA